MTNKNEIIQVSDLVNEIEGKLIHDKLDFQLKKGEICAIVGGSGSGKTTLIRSILQLQPIISGTIKVFNQDMSKHSFFKNEQIRKRWGVLFQHGALFSSLSVLDNICFPLKEFTNLKRTDMHEIAMLRLRQVGLSCDTAWKFPAHLSGGMVKRVALARAIALEPELLFLDEPTAGLDPISSDLLEELILSLQASLGLSILLVTHDMDTLWTVPDTVSFLCDGRVLSSLPINELVESDNEQIKAYFSGKRGQKHY